MLDYAPESICDAPLDPYAVDYLFADACPCGAQRVDETFCAPCRAEHEAMIERLAERVRARYALLYSLVRSPVTINVTRKATRS